MKVYIITQFKADGYKICIVRAETKEKALEKYHTKNPIKHGINIEELQTDILEIIDYSDPNYEG